MNHPVNSLKVLLVAFLWKDLKSNEITGELFVLLKKLLGKSVAKFKKKTPEKFLGQQIFLGINCLSNF